MACSVSIYFCRHRLSWFVLVFNGQGRLVYFFIELHIRRIKGYLPNLSSCKKPNVSLFQIWTLQLGVTSKMRIKYLFSCTTRVSSIKHFTSSNSREISLNYFSSAPCIILLRAGQQRYCSDM